MQGGTEEKLREIGGKLVYLERDKGCGALAGYLSSLTCVGVDGLLGA